MEWDFDVCLCELYAIKIVLEILFIHPNTSPLLCDDNNECRGISWRRGTENTGHAELRRLLLSVQGRVNAASVEMKKCDQEFSNLHFTSVIWRRWNKWDSFSVFSPLWVWSSFSCLCCSVFLLWGCAWSRPWLLRLSGIRMMSTWGSRRKGGLNCLSSPSNRSFGSKKCSCQYIAFVFHPSPDIPRYSSQTHGTEVCSPEITLCSSVPGVSCFSAEADNVVVWLLQISKFKKSQQKSNFFSKTSRNGADGVCSSFPWFQSDSTGGFVVSHCTQCEF